jgi:predicted nucleic acid-binding protein
MNVFMDTFALIAWINSRDAAHERVKSYLNSTAELRGLRCGFIVAGGSDR